MNKQNFPNCLSDNNISLENMRLNDEVKDDAFCIRKNYTCVEAFWRESESV